MDWPMPSEPYLDRERSSPVETVIVPRTRDLGDGFEVRRALPSQRRRMVGPFVFLDEMGPALFGPGRGLDVRPHPHIGLATVTYLFEGEILHRDSLGSVQAIRPGAVNWMTAGRGIVHSERTPPAARAAGGRLFGIQTWVALPLEHEEASPSFAHPPAEALPLLDGDGARVRLVAGELHGARSPVPTLSETLFADGALAPGARLVVPRGAAERAVFVAAGAIDVGGERHEEGRLIVLRPGADVALDAPAAARVIVLGGEPMDGPRHVWWNFVSSSRERIEAAKRAWLDGTIGAVPGDPERIPLPDAPGVARYP